jgi:hypothetical protein
LTRQASMSDIAINEIALTNIAYFTQTLSKVTIGLA